MLPDSLGRPTRIHVHYWNSLIVEETNSIGLRLENNIQILMTNFNFK